MIIHEPRCKPSGPPKECTAPHKILASRTQDKIGTRTRIFQGEIYDKDILEGQWKQIRARRNHGGQTHRRRSHSSRGKYETLAGVLQEKYGYTRQQAKTEIDKRVTALNQSEEDETYPTK